MKYIPLAGISEMGQKNDINIFNLEVTSHLKAVQNKHIVFSWKGTLLYTSVKPVLSGHSKEVKKRAKIRN